jgi:hypothetical protein
MSAKDKDATVDQGADAPDVSGESVAEHRRLSKVEQARADYLRRQREANHEGPSHPAHDFHAQWLADRGLTEEWDQRARYNT